jgi:hypothetical protein
MLAGELQLSKTLSRTLKIQALIWLRTTTAKQVCEFKLSTGQHWARAVKSDQSTSQVSHFGVGGGVSII